MKLVPLAVVAGVVALALASRRDRAPFWLAPAAASCTALIGLLSVWQSMSRLGDFLSKLTFDPEMPQRIFTSAVGDFLAPAAFGAVMAAILVAGSALGLAFHARASADEPRKLPGRGWFMALGVLAFAGLWFARASMDTDGGVGLFSALAAGLGMTALVLGARSLADDPHGHRHRDLVEVSALGIVSIAFASLGPIVLIVKNAYRAVGGESVDPSQ